MRKQELPFIGEFYADETRPWSQQDVVNWLPCAAESPGTRTPTMLKTPPGLSPFVELINVNDPVRGVYNAEGRLFVTVGDTFSQIAPDGTPDTLGTISGVSRVRMAHNQISGGNQVVAVNGSAGYVYNTVTDLFGIITDPGYPGGVDAVFIDGFIVQIEPARRYAFNSEAADATAYNTLDRFTSEVSPDLLVGMAVSNNELLLLSERTGEFFYNSGAAQQPFRSKRISFNKGCAGRYTVVTMDNTVYWLGNDGVFYALDGYSPRRVSNRPIEQAIRGLNWAQAFAMVWEDAGHSVCYWTFPDGLTFGFDASQLKWHRRASYGLSRWRVNDLAFWRQRWIAGDFQYGRLWELDWDYILEGDQEFISEATGPVLSDNQNLVKMPRLEFMLDVGQEETAVRTFGPPQLQPQYFVYFIGGITAPSTSQIGYASVNPNSGEITVLADAFFDGYESLHEGGISTNGTNRVFVTGFTADPVVSAYSVAGSALTLAGSYTGAGQFHGLANAGDRVYVAQRDTDLKVLMLDYDGAAFALVDSQVVSAEPGAFNHGVLLHQAYVMVYADNTIGAPQIKAYTVTGDNFTEVGSLAVEIDEPAQPGMWSDGIYLYLDIEGAGDKVSIYTFNGTTFTEVTSVADPTHLTNGVMGGNGRVVVRRLNAGVMTLEVSAFDGVTISAPTNSIVSPTYVAWAYDAATDYLYAPGGPTNTLKAGLYDLAQSFTAEELGTNTTALPIPDTGVPVQSTISVSSDTLIESSGIVIDVDITHPFIGDLLVTITEPGGQVYTLHDDDGVPGVNLVASIPARFTSPATVSGTWTLTITDTATPDVGTLNNWQVTRIPAVLNNRFILSIDGEDPAEIFEGGFIRGCPELH